MRLYAGLTVTALLLSAAPTAANELRVETLRVHRPAGSTTLRVESIVRWKNAWRNARNHDAVWVVVKVRGTAAGEWVHARLARVSAESAVPAASCTVSGDKTGVFCSPAATYRGDVALRLA